jgi:hypothetical protein
MAFLAIVAVREMKDAVECDVCGLTMTTMSKARMFHSFG